MGRGGRGREMIRTYSAMLVHQRSRGGHWRSMVEGAGGFLVNGRSAGGAGLSVLELVIMGSEKEMGRAMGTEVEKLLEETALQRHRCHRQVIELLFCLLAHFCYWKSRTTIRGVQWIGCSDALRETKREGGRERERYCKIGIAKGGRGRETTKLNHGVIGVLLRAEPSELLESFEFLIASVRPELPGLRRFGQP